MNHYKVKAKCLFKTFYKHTESTILKWGANTFPFHNLLPYSESNEGLFLFFLPSLNWIKEKSMANLAICNICDQKQNKPKSVLPPYYRTGDSAGETP